LVAAGCGGDSKDRAVVAPAGKTVRGETETGMKLKVETFLAPSADPELAKLDKYRAKVGYQAVDFHRITADNTKGSVPDRGRPVDFATNADAIATGHAIETRFVCDVLHFEWLPKPGSTGETATYHALLKELCANGPPKQDGIAPGSRQSYFVITDRGFSSRGIKTMRVFGPLSAELR
jgi:hypothetical protein